MKLTLSKSIKNEFHDSDYDLSIKLLTEISINMNSHLNDELFMKFQLLYSRIEELTRNDL